MDHDESLSFEYKVHFQSFESFVPGVALMKENRLNCFSPINPSFSDLKEINQVFEHVGFAADIKANNYLNLR